MCIRDRSIRAEPCRVISAAAPLCSQTSSEPCTDRKCCGKGLTVRRNLQNEMVSVYLFCVKNRPRLGLCQSTVCKTHRALFSHCEQVHTHFVKCFFSFTLLRNKLLASFGEVVSMTPYWSAQSPWQVYQGSEDQGLVHKFSQVLLLTTCIVIPAWKSQS